MMKQFICKFSFFIAIVSALVSCKEEPPAVDFSVPPVDTTYVDGGIQAGTQLKNVLIEDFTGVKCINCPKAQAQAKQAEMQMAFDFKQQELQANIEAERAKQEYQSQENQLRIQLEMQRDELDRQMEMKLAQMKMMTERNTQLLLAYVNNGAKVELERVKGGLDSGEGYIAEYDYDEDMTKAMEHPMQPIANAITQGNQELMGQIAGMIDMLAQSQNRPKQVIRDEQGKIIGVQ